MTLDKILIGISALALFVSIVVGYYQNKDSKSRFYKFKQNENNLEILIAEVVSNLNTKEESYRKSFNHVAEDILEIKHERRKSPFGNISSNPASYTTDEKQKFINDIREFDEPLKKRGKYILERFNQDNLDFNYWLTKECKKILNLLEVIGDNEIPTKSHKKLQKLRAFLNEAIDKKYWTSVKYKLSGIDMNEINTVKNENISKLIEIRNVLSKFLGYKRFKIKNKK